MAKKIKKGTRKKINGKIYTAVKYNQNTKGGAKEMAKRIRQNFNRYAVIVKEGNKYRVYQRNK